jgi:large subunit ribosomal protein L13
MTKSTQTKEYTIDAGEKPLGRTASRIAHLLRGKDLPEFQPNVVPSVKVKVSNISKIKLTGAKWKDKSYARYSGYPGGLKNVSFKTSFEKNPEQTFKKVVENMLPKNRLRKKLMGNLIFE